MSDKIREPLYMDSLKNYQIWSEGYQITGNSGAAHFRGEARGNSFAAACIALLGEDEYFDAENLTYWSCRLFDNEEDARMSFG